MRTRTCAGALAALALLTAAAGCGGESKDTSGGGTASPGGTAGAGAVSVTDMSGHTTSFDGPVTRVVNTWPSSVATMVCLGQGDKIVGTHPYPKSLALDTAIYPKLASVPTVQDNVEEMAKLDPQAVVTVGPEDLPALEKAGLKGVDLFFSDYATMKKSLNALGTMLGGQGAAKAADLAAYTDSTISSVTSKLGTLPDAQRPLVYYVAGGMYDSTGAKTIMSEWTRLAGGRYATDDLGTGMGVKVNKEDILRKNPDVIVVSGGTKEDRAIADAFRTAPEWKDIKAVRNKRIVVAPIGCFGWDRFGPESALQPLWLAHELHPDKVKVDMAATARDFYRRFAGYDIGDAQLKKVLAGDSEPAGTPAG